MVNQWAPILLSKLALTTINSFTMPPTYKTDTPIISHLRMLVIRLLPLTMRSLKSLSMTISRKLHLALSSLSDVVLLSSDNTAKLNSVTASNSFASATTKANTEPALPFNDTTATAAQNSAARLSALSHQTYHVKWNGAMYFLVIFSSMMGAALVVWLSQLIVKRKLRKKERGSTGRLNDGIFLSPRHPEKGWSERCETEQRSDIIVFDESRFKRTTKLLEALRGKNISHPIESGEGRYDSSRE